MNGILGMTDLALDTELSAEQAEFLRVVKASADSLLRIINDILDFSKIEAGKLDLVPEPFSLQNLLDELLRIFQVQAQEKNITLRTEAAPDLPKVLIGDSDRLRQVLVNLIGNAVKFTKAGEVAVEVNPVSVTDQEAILRFAVRDTGIGIAPEKQAAVFRVFEQADSSTTRKFGGTGLGLSISSKLVEMMDGQIELQSELGKGSTFSFTAKFRVSADLSLIKETRETVPELPKLRILMAEDNPINQKLGLRLLEKWGHQVTLAGDGKEAVALFEPGRFDLILMDVSMPILDGFAAVRVIRERERAVGTHVPILALTAHAMKGDRGKCLEAGMDDYITKPLQIDELKKTIFSLVTNTGIN